MTYYKQVENQIFNTDNVRKICSKGTFASEMSSVSEETLNTLFIFHVTIVDSNSEKDQVDSKNDIIKNHNKILKFILGGCNSSNTRELIKPIAVYSSSNKFYVIYNQLFVNDTVRWTTLNNISSTIDNCSSMYSSVISNFLNSVDLKNKCVCTNIVEIPTQVNLVAYISWKIFEEARNVIMNLSKNLTPEDRYKPWNELIDTLQNVDKQAKLKWDSLTKFDKFGQISKVDKETRKIVALQEMINFKNIEKYLSFIFR